MRKILFNIFKINVNKKIGLKKIAVVGRLLLVV
jgi:hypothetical protein